MIRALALLLLATPAVATTGYDKMVILAVGVSDYVHGISAADGCLKSKDRWCDLPNGHVDAYRFASVFQRGGFMTEPEVILLPEARSDRAGILAAIDEAASKAEAGKRALFVLYFVGHGETKGQTGYIVPRDGIRTGATARNSWISMGTLRDKLGSYPGIRHQLVILGSCFSGTVLRSKTSESAGRLRRGKRSTLQFIKREIDRLSRIAITAGGRDDRVPDGDSAAGSPFGAALVDAFVSTEGLARMSADYNDDGCVTHKELGTWLVNEGRSAENTPHEGAFGENQRATILFCRVKDAPVPPAPTVDPQMVRRGGSKAFGFDHVFTPLPKTGSVVAAKTPRRPALVYIPAGSFTMGSPAGEPGREPREVQHRVSIVAPFAMMRTEVTQGQWEAVLGTSPSRFRGCGADCPVEQVSWWEALAYANALSKVEGRSACYRLSGCDQKSAGQGMACRAVEWVGGCTGYRLPTEAEWEYAARAGTRTAVYTGALTIKGKHHAPEFDAIGWYGGNNGVAYDEPESCATNQWTERQYPGHTLCGTHPVGEKRPNPWGLHDMLGNVWEWCWDWYGAYPKEPQTDPRGPANGGFRITRGGSWTSQARGVRVAYHFGKRPGERSNNQGLRLVRRPDVSYKLPRLSPSPLPPAGTAPPTRSDR